MKKLSAANLPIKMLCHLGAVEGARSGEHDFNNPLYDEGAQGSQAQTENPYSKLQRPPKQKSFAPPKNGFPYTMDHNEEASYQLDLAGQGGAQDTVKGIQPNESANDPANGHSSEVNHEGKASLSAVSEQSPAALAGGIYDLATCPTEQVVYDVADHPHQELARPLNDYADVTHTSPLPVSSVDPTDHEYADTTATRMPHPSDSKQEQQPPVIYTNTTPGEITQEALNHYDFGQ